ncbi:alpha/beta fold hydrolase [Streptomyces melanogenes]|uniref:alpha/beta fold hydrolase n=1 Tax=Streptomyces melanogenes TaxID=67326 RepID=UPI00167D6847|nr:alpha/beta hydrolase [Streptomyces melanogenes]GGP33433.1 alpha/beta hydrolase [Streptomyces melanogenes]
MPYVTVNGVKLFHTDAGAGTPVLFLHGWGTSGRVWDAQVADLAPDHRVVTVDCRGCGRSEHPPTGNTTRTNVEDILALISHLGLEKPLLVGSSLGATFALETALRAPRHVAGVVSISGPGYWPSQGMAGALRSLISSLATDRAATVADWVPKWFGPAAPVELVRRTVRQILASGHFIDELFTEAMSHDPREAVTGIPVPVAYLHGRHDTEIPLEVSRTLAALTPYGTFHTIEQAGHMAHQEQPAAVNSLIRVALDSLATDALHRS